MPSDKPRLCILLLRHSSEAYGSADFTLPNEEDRFAWALLTGPKHDKDSYTLYRVKTYLIPGPARQSEESDDSQRTLVVNANPPVIPQRRLEVSSDLTRLELGSRIPLIRIVFGKIENEQELDTCLRNTIPEQNVEDSLTQVPSVEWVRKVLSQLEIDKRQKSQRTCIMGTSVLDWESVRDTAMAYVRQQLAQEASTSRAYGQASAIREFGKIATFDMLAMRETE